MRYFVTTLVCAAFALIGAILWVEVTLPAGEGSFGVAKLVPLYVAFFSVLLFGVFWFPMTALVFFGSRRKSHGSQRGSVLPQTVLLIVSALAFVPSCLGFYSICRDELRSKRLESLVSNPRIDSQDLMSAIDRYCTNSHRGLSETRETRMMQRLSRNRSTPPEFLSHIANNLDDRSALLSGIAENPNCPSKILERFRSIPSLADSLARNPQTSPELLAELSSSTDNTVRVFVARNPRTPRPAIERLAKDSDELVRNYAKENMNGTLGAFAVQ